MASVLSVWWVRCTCHEYVLAVCVRILCFVCVVFMCGICGVCVICV